MSAICAFEFKAQQLKAAQSGEEAAIKHCGLTWTETRHEKEA